MTDSTSPQPSDPTPLCAIISAVLRIISIKFALEGVNFLVSILPSISTHGAVTGYLLGFGVVIVCTYWLWKLSPFLSRRITRGKDPSLAASQFGVLDLYTFAFLLTGLYFAVDAFGPSLTWFHYVLSKSSSEAGVTLQQKGNFYTLFTYLVKLFLGLALIFNGRKFAAKLIKRDNEAA